MPSFALFLFAALAADTSDFLRVDDAWIREAPPGAAVMAAYGTLCNTTNEALTLAAVTSDAFGRIEMHETIETDASVFMRRVEKLEFRKQECVTFKPGGLHFMLFAPANPLRAGDRATFTLAFTNGAQQQVALDVRRADEMIPHHEHH